MKQLLLAALSLASLFVPGFATAQSYDCFLVCNPARVYCQPVGSPVPPMYKLCSVGSGTSSPDSLAKSLRSSESAQAPPACAAQQVFDEETQTYEWQMVCD